MTSFKPTKTLMEQLPSQYDDIEASPDVKSYRQAIKSLMYFTIDIIPVLAIAVRK